MEWMTTPREESGLLCFLFCVTVVCPGLLLLSLLLSLLLLLASSVLLTPTDLSMFERVSAVMHSASRYLTCLSFCHHLRIHIYPPSLTYMMYPSYSQWRRPAEIHLPLSVKLCDLDCTQHCLSAELRAAECYPVLLGLHAYAEQVQCDRMGDLPREESLHACYVCETLCRVMSCRHGS